MQKDSRAADPLTRLLFTLEASDTALKRDIWRGQGAKGDRAIHGKLGHIYEDGTGFLLFYTTPEKSTPRGEQVPSPRPWERCWPITKRHTQMSRRPHRATARSFLRWRNKQLDRPIADACRATRASREPLLLDEDDGIDTAHQLGIDFSSYADVDVME